MASSNSTIAHGTTKGSGEQINQSQAEVPRKYKSDFYSALIHGDETLTNVYGQYFSTPITNTFTAPDCDIDCVKNELERVETCTTDLPSAQHVLVCDSLKHSCQPSKTKLQSEEIVQMNIALYPIHVVAAKGSVEVMETLLQHGADMYSLTQPSSYLPFELAVNCGNYSVAERLLNHGFCLNTEKNRREPQLKEAEWTDFLEIWMESSCLEEFWPRVDLSLRAGHSLDEDSWIDCLFHALCCTFSHPALLRGLLDMKYLQDSTGYWDQLQTYGVSSEIQETFDLPKYTLMYAACTEEAVNTLFDYGLNPLENKSQEVTPGAPLLYHHIDEGRLAVAEAILKRCPESLDEIGSSNYLEYFINAKTLHLLAGGESQESADLIACFKMLVRHGARINELTPCGETVLTLACKWIPDSHVEAVECIFDLGFNLIDHQNKSGDTALMLASSPSNRGFSSRFVIVNSLLKHRANPSLSNNNNITPTWVLIIRNTMLNGLLMRPSCILPILYVNTPLHGFSEDPFSPLKGAINREDKYSVKALASCGWYLNECRSIIDNLANTSYHDHGKPEFRTWIDSLVSKPPSLQWWAKRVIRRTLPVYPFEAVRQLPIPDKLKEFILMVVKLDAEQTEKLQKFEWLPPDYKRSRYFSHISI